MFLQVIILCYIAIFVLVLVAASVIPSFPPVGMEDFVVNRNSDIVLFSYFSYKIYIYSPDLKLKKSFNVGGSGGAFLAIGENNDIYIENGDLLVYDMNGTFKNAFPESPGILGNWRLTRESKVEEFRGSSGVTTELTRTKRLRRLARPGDILFYKLGLIEPENVQDPFIDDNGNRYVTKGWFYGIKVYNRKGKLIKELNPPFFLRPFLSGFPGLYVTFGCAFILIFISIVFKNQGLLSREFEMGERKESPIDRLLR